LPGGGIKGGEVREGKGETEGASWALGIRVRAKSSAHVQKKKSKNKEDDDLFLKEQRCLVARYEYLVPRVVSEAPDPMSNPGDLKDQDGE
jgi:hypothetical protein